MFFCLLRIFSIFPKYFIDLTFLLIVHSNALWLSLFLLWSCDIYYFFVLLVSVFFVFLFYFHIFAYSLGFFKFSAAFGYECSYLLHVAHCCCCSHCIVAPALRNLQCNRMRFFITCSTHKSAFLSSLALFALYVTWVIHRSMRERLQLFCCFFFIFYLVVIEIVVCYWIRLAYGFKCVYQIYISEVWRKIFNSVYLVKERLLEIWYLEKV